MQNVFTKLVVLMLLAGTIVSCVDKKIAGPEEPSSPYRSLKNKDDVLFNLFMSYKERNLAEYENILSPGFTFVFYSEDSIQFGTPSQWKKESEMIATNNLFDSGPQSTFQGLSGLQDPGSGPSPSSHISDKITWGLIKYLMLSDTDSTVSMSLVLSYETGDSAWAAVEPPDTNFRGQTWYKKDVIYNLLVETKRKYVYYSLDYTAAFYVRYVGSRRGGIWQIVRWEDAVERPSL